MTKKSKDLHQTPYKPGKSAGYDREKRRYRDASGKLISRSQYLSSLNEPKSKEGFGFFVPHYPTETEALGRIEKLVAAAQHGKDIASDPIFKQAASKYNEIMAFVEETPRSQDNPVKPIPSNIRAAMNLSRYYCNIYGDFKQHIEAPLDVTITDLDIQSGDPGYKKALRELYDNIGIEDLIYQAWMCTSMYGISIPVEVWEEKELKQVILLPPEFVWIGYYTTLGTIAPENTYSLEPYTMQKWTRELVKSTMLPMTYNSFQNDWNNQIAQGWNIPLDSNFVHPIRAKSFPWERYPQPPTAGAFRPLGSRAVYDEMFRAVVEGIKNQLWVFILGDAEHRPSPEQMTAFRNTLAGASGERTGYLSWIAPLKVEQHTAKSSEILGWEVRQELTLEVFRSIGGSIRILTGNALANSKETGGIEIDLNIWLKRIEFIRRKVLSWEGFLRKRWAEKQGTAAIKANEGTTTSFSKSLLENSVLIQNELRPLYMLGPLSATTLLQKAGYNMEQELKNKEAEQPNKELLSPPTAYVQETVNPNTKPSKTETTEPLGRPRNNDVSANVETWDDNETKKVLFAEVYAALRMLSDSQDENAFIESLKTTMRDRLRQVTLESYRFYGGTGNPTDYELGLSADFVNSFAEGFRSSLRSTKFPIDVDVVSNRALLYPTEGFKMAVINGQILAMRERGARYWRRVLHPELSESGPCERCQADSTIIHSTDEPFLSLHPNEVCSNIELSIQYITEGNIPSIAFPVPKLSSTIPSDLKGRTHRNQNQ